MASRALSVGRPEDLPVEVVVVRELTQEDVKRIRETDSAASSALAHRPLERLHHGHHELAQVLARGVSQEHAGLITGYDPTRISRMLRDPIFANLVAYYASAQEALYTETLGRMNSLGLVALDELQEKLESEDWSKRELMDLARLTIVEPLKASVAARHQAQSSGGVVNIKFVSADNPAPAGPVIDVEEVVE